MVYCTGVLLVLQVPAPRTRCDINQFQYEVDLSLSLKIILINANNWTTRKSLHYWQAFMLRISIDKVFN